jgi:hypothetical protein
MVALNGVEPWLLQPIQNLLTLRPTVDQIAYAEQPINCRVEPELIKRILQASKTPVDITDNEVAAGRVAIKALDPW